MPTTKLEQVRELVDQLTPLEQALLLEYMTPRLAQAIAASHPASESPKASTAEAWEAFFQIGDELTHSDVADIPTLTQAVITMRR